MKIRVQCPNGHSMLAKPALEGKRVACPKCSAPFVVQPIEVEASDRPGGTGPEPAAASQPAAGDPLAGDPLGDDPLGLGDLAVAAEAEALNALGGMAGEVASGEPLGEAAADPLRLLAQGTSAAGLGTAGVGGSGRAPGRKGQGSGGRAGEASGKMVLLVGGSVVGGLMLVALLVLLFKFVGGGGDREGGGGTAGSEARATGSGEVSSGGASTDGARPRLTLLAPSGAVRVLTAPPTSLPTAAELPSGYRVLVGQRLPVHLAGSGLAPGAPKRNRYTFRLDPQGTLAAVPMDGQLVVVKLADMQLVARLGLKDKIHALALSSTHLAVAHANRKVVELIELDGARPVQILETEHQVEDLFVDGQHLLVELILPPPAGRGHVLVDLRTGEVPEILECLGANEEGNLFASRLPGGDWLVSGYLLDAEVRTLKSLPSAGVSYLAGMDLGAVVLPGLYSDPEPRLPTALEGATGFSFSHVRRDAKGPWQLGAVYAAAGAAEGTGRTVTPFFEGPPGLDYQWQAAGTSVVYRAAQPRDASVGDLGLYYVNAAELDPPPLRRITDAPLLTLVEGPLELPDEGQSKIVWRVPRGYRAESPNASAGRVTPKLQVEVSGDLLSVTFQNSEMVAGLRRGLKAEMYAVLNKLQLPPGSSGDEYVDAYLPPAAKAYATITGRKAAGIPVTLAVNLHVQLRPDDETQTRRPVQLAHRMFWQATRREALQLVGPIPPAPGRRGNR